MHRHEPSLLVGAALFYTCAMDWAVAPLTYLPTLHAATTSNCSCGRRQCDHPCAHPPDELPEARSRLPRDVIKWWSRAPFNIGLPTGQDIAAVDVPADTGATLLRHLRKLGVELGPVLAARDRYQFLVQPQHQRTAQQFPEALGDGLPDHDARYLGAGKMLIAPPSVLAAGTVHWVIEPDLARSYLPDAVDLLALLVQSRAKDGSSSADAATPRRVASDVSGSADNQKREDVVD